MSDARVLRAWVREERSRTRDVRVRVLGEGGCRGDGWESGGGGWVWNKDGGSGGGGSGLFGAVETGGNWADVGRPAEGGNGAEISHRRRLRLSRDRDGAMVGGRGWMEQCVDQPEDNGRRDL